VDSVKSRRVHDGIHAGNGCTNIINVADIPDYQRVSLRIDVPEVKQAQRVASCRKRRDDGASEVSPGAGDQDLHKRFIPGMSLRILRRITIAVDVCFKYITRSRGLLGCLIALIE
jgi:hypothetical protein